MSIIVAILEIYYIYFHDDFIDLYTKWKHRDQYILIRVKHKGDKDEENR